jgi:hypothetical protein
MERILAAAAVGSSNIRAWVPGGSGILLLSATLAPGGRRTALEMAGSVAAAPGSSGVRPRLWGKVNGVALEAAEPAGDRHAASAGSAAPERATFRFRLDLDRAERAHPGRFLERPLRLELFAGDSAERGFHAATAALTGRLVRKARRLRRAALG